MKKELLKAKINSLAEELDVKVDDKIVKVRNTEAVEAYFRSHTGAGNKYLKDIWLETNLDVLKDIFAKHGLTYVCKSGCANIGSLLHISLK